MTFEEWFYRGNNVEIEKFKGLRATIMARMYNATQAAWQAGYDEAVRQVREMKEYTFWKEFEHGKQEQREG